MPLSFADAPGVSAAAVALHFGAQPGGGVEVNFVVQFGFGVGMVAGYDAAIFAGLQRSVRVAHSVASELVVSHQAGWDESGKLDVAFVADFEVAHELRAAVHLMWSADFAVRESFWVPYGIDSERVGMVVAAAWENSARAVLIDLIAWQQSQAASAATRLAFDLADRINKTARVPWDVAGPFGRTAAVLFDQRARPMLPSTAVAWDVAAGLQSAGGGRYLPTPPGPVPPRPDAFVPLRFCQVRPSYAFAGNSAGRVALIFGFNFCGGVTPDAPLFILPARVYMVTHNVFAVRLPDGQPVQITGCTISAEVGSFGWQLSATGPGDLFGQLAPVNGLPAQIQVTIDGAAWVFAVTTRQHSREFGRNTVSISGISQTYLVGAPLARELAWLNTSPYTAQQLAAQALDLTGVALDWGIDDWLVPAGAYSQMGTPLAAVQAIAQAAGGYVQSHRTAPTLLVRHPYPTLAGGVPGGPWNWSSVTADVEIAQDAVIVSAIEPTDGPDIDGVYVSGTNQGVLALVRRSGTAGAKLAPMVTDALITAAAAAQQRGLAVIGQAGARQNVTLELPVLTGLDHPGVLDVGQLIQINDTIPYRGRVRSVSVAVNRPTVRQTVILEQHFE